MKKNIKQKGFTLVELLLYMGIFTILLAVTLQMFSSIFDVQLESQATSSVAQDSKYIMGRITHDLNRAQSISVPSAYSTSSATLTLVINGQTYTYSLSGEDLLLENITTGTTDRINSSETTVSDVSYLRLDGNGKDSIQMSFTLTSLTARRGGKEVETFQTTAGIR